MSDSQNHSITGGWLGTYHYRGFLASNPPVRFEATLTAADAGRFAGTILDDGGGGEARATGVQTGSQVVFTKVYTGPRHGYVHPVEYEGTLSGDGKTMRGTWHIQAARGVWEARRIWSEEICAAQDTTEETKSGVRELTAA